MDGRARPIQRRLNIQRTAKRSSAEVHMKRRDKVRFCSYQPDLPETKGIASVQASINRSRLPRAKGDCQTA